jgi:D-alanyl-D-alanine carboxypeptidase/D-alanyl-D-alanine-endopeptidase (penicillin-binding protein 4)
MPMPPSRSFAGLLALVCALLLPAGPALALDLTGLQKKLRSETAKLGARSGAYVADLTTGEELYARRADLALSPASNEKLFTTATALLRFGPDATLTTSVRATPGAAIGEDGVLRGDLYLVGGGDPSLDDADLKTLARRLRHSGIRRVTGAVIGDESAFDTLRGSYDTRFKADGDIGGWLGALTWGHGRAHPGGPAKVAAARLRHFLEAARVKVGAGARSGRLAQAQAGGAGEPLAAVQSPPIARLIQITNQPSDNFYAETLVTGIGARFGAGGTTAAGLSVMRAQMKALHLSPKMVDGSGLSRTDRATPRQIVTLLATLRKMPIGDDFVASLAVAGRIGTLAHRMRGTAAAGRCPAKTGTLRGVSALSGFCTTTSGHLIAFSFLENRVNASGAKRIEDRMVPAIARYESSSASSAGSSSTATPRRSAFSSFEPGDAPATT